MAAKQRGEAQHLRQAVGLVFQQQHPQGEQAAQPQPRWALVQQQRVEVQAQQAQQAQVQAVQQGAQQQARPVLDSGLPSALWIRPTGTAPQNHHAETVKDAAFGVPRMTAKPLQNSRQQYTL